MALNLKERKKKTFELILLDGTELQIKKANEALILKMEDFEKSLRVVKTVKDVFDGVKNMVLEILNRNTANKIYDALFFEQKDDEGDLIYDYEVCMAIFSAYSKFTQEVLKNPN